MIFWPPKSALTIPESGLLHNDIQDSPVTKYMENFTEKVTSKRGQIGTTQRPLLRDKIGSPTTLSFLLNDTLINHFIEISLNRLFTAACNI